MKTIIAVIFLVFTIIIGMSMIEESFSTPNVNGTQVIVEESYEESSIEQKVKVILTGEVVKPGSYMINTNDYLDSAIQLAGGTTSKADYSCINFLYVVTKDVAIYIAPISDIDKISINDAPIEELVQLEGIGPTLANQIITYRESNGGFLCLEDLMNVKGIGKQTFEKNKDKICL